MKIRDIMETPIDDWIVDPDFDRNERTMIDKFHGYSGERLHFPDTDKKAIRDPDTIKKIRNSFLKIPYRFNIYFWQGENPDYDPYLQYGLADRSTVERLMGEQVAERVFGKSGITVIMTNNLSDERYISLRSPWIFAHRIAHALIGGHTGDVGGRVIDKFQNFVFKIAAIGYGIEWNTWHHGIYTEEMEVIAKLLGHKLGTMRSARSGQLVQSHEWFYETFVQYLMTGKVTFNKLPPSLDEYHPLTTNPRKQHVVFDLWRKFPHAIMRLFNHTLNEASGKVFII